jgi:hypothetical protein
MACTVKGGCFDFRALRLGGLCDTSRVEKAEIDEY